MRLLLVSSLFAPEVGGVCTVAEQLASNIAAEVAVVAARAGKVGDWAAYDARFPFSVHRVEAFETELSKALPGRVRGVLQFGYNVLWTRRRAAASIARFVDGRFGGGGPDVLCINTLGSYWLAGRLKRRYPGMKVVFYLHGEEVGGGPGARRMDGLRNEALRAADAVVVVSRFTGERALRCGVVPGKMRVIHNGVDIARFTPGPKDAAIVRRFELEGKRVLLCLARLDARKGQDMLIRAMPAIRGAGPSAVLLLVGGGEYEGRLRGLASDLGLNDCVIFAGFAAAEEVAAYYRTADVYAMPNREMESGDTEGFGLVFLEAGACGCPVIGGRAGGVPDAIVEGETGYLVDGTSPAEIAEACARLLGDPALCAKLGANGLAHSREDTWKRQAARLLELCEALTARGAV